MGDGRPLAAAAAVLALHCASPPRYEKQAPPPPRVSYELPLEGDFTVGAVWPLVLWFEVPLGDGLDLHFKLPAGFDYQYVLSHNGDEIRIGHLVRSTLIVLTDIPAGRYKLTVTSGGRGRPIWLRVETRSKDRELPPVSLPGSSPPTSPPPDVDHGCPLPPSYADEIAFGQSVSRSFGTSGKSARHWLTFSLEQRSPVYVALRISHRHPMRIFVADASGCTVESSNERWGTIETTLPRGRYFIRVDTSTSREREMRFTVFLDRMAPSPAPVPSVVIPPPMVPRRTPSTPPPTKPPPPSSPQLRCAEFHVDQEAEWVVVVDPLRPNDPPTRLRLAVTDSGGRTVAQLASPEHQPCLLTRRYRLHAGVYRACVLTVAPVDYRPDVSIKVYPAAQEAPTTKVVRDCE